MPKSGDPGCVYKLAVETFRNQEMGLESYRAVLWILRKEPQSGLIKIKAARIFKITTLIFEKPMKLSQAKIDQIKEYFRDKPVLKAYVFGSYARKEATAKSDLDILVELDYRHHIGLEFIQMKLDLESLLHKEVDLVTPEGLSRHVKPIIEKDKVLIYAR